MRKKALEIEEWKQNSLCNSCAFTNQRKQGEQQNKNSTWKKETAVLHAHINSLGLKQKAENFFID